MNAAQETDKYGFLVLTDLSQHHQTKGESVGEVKFNTIPTSIHHQPITNVWTSMNPAANATDKTEVEHKENCFTRAEGCQLFMNYHMTAFYAR